MPIYNSIYQLIEQYIYGTVEIGTYQELVCILFSTGACLFAMSVPFIVVYLIIRFIISCCQR